MLEGLTKYWGFYLVAIPDPTEVVVRDLHVQEKSRLGRIPSAFGMGL